MKQVIQFANTRAGQVVVLAAVAAGALYLAERKARKVAAAINPVSDQNVIYQGANAVGESITGEQGFNLGYWIYDVLHGKGG